MRTRAIFQLSQVIDQLTINQGMDTFEEMWTIATKYYHEEKRCTYLSASWRSNFFDLTKSLLFAAIAITMGLDAICWSSFTHFLTRMKESLFVMSYTKSAAAVQ